MSLHAGLQTGNAKNNVKVDGILGFSGYLFQFTKLGEKLKQMQIQLCHGKDDNVIPFTHAEKSYQRLLN